MCRLLLIITVILLFNDMYSQDNKSAIAEYSNYKPITLRTYYLEVSRLINSNISYNNFLRNTQNKFFLKQNISIIETKGYKIVLIDYNKIQAYKDFKRLEVIKGNKKEINRLQTIKLNNHENH